MSVLAMFRGFLCPRRTGGVSLSVLTGGGGVGHMFPTSDRGRLAHQASAPAVLRILARAKGRILSYGYLIFCFCCAVTKREVVQKKALQLGAGVQVHRPC